MFYIEAGVFIERLDRIGLDWIGLDWIGSDWMAVFEFCVLGSDTQNPQGGEAGRGSVCSSFFFFRSNLYGRSGCQYSPNNLRVCSRGRVMSIGAELRSRVGCVSVRKKESV